MKIKYAQIYVNDQEKALKFYTETLGFVKKGDVTAGEYRWLTVTSPQDKDGTELILNLNSNPAAKEYQQATFSQDNPAISFTVGDVQAEHKRLEDLGVKFTTEPTEVMPGVTIAVFNDTCGNLIQIQTT